jgi:phosphoribosylanthranilate isomerase
VKQTRIKICGITSVADAALASDSGADAIGLVLYKPSPRNVTISQAKEIALHAGPFVTVVGLFVDAPAEFVYEVLAQVPLHVLQFHGDESRDYCESFQRPYMKAIRMRPELDIAAAIADYPSAVAILLDAYRPGVPGGTGETFDWQRVPHRSSKPLVLAGGLTPINVAEAIATTQVYGVDVSGGVEASPGKKDAIKIKDFIINASNGA